MYDCTCLHYFSVWIFILFFFRQNGLGYTSFVAWLVVSVSPFIMLLEDVWYLLPAVTYCAVAVGSSLLASLLPETVNVRLPETIEDIEKPRKRGSVSKEDCRYLMMMMLIHNRSSRW